MARARGARRGAGRAGGAGPRSPPSLDAAIAWHVLEHLDDPARPWRGSARGCARAAGVVVACPNLASLQARIGGDRWFHQDVPRHRTHFTASRAAPAARALRVPGRADQPPARRAESARDVADAAQPAHPRARRRFPGAEAATSGAERGIRPRPGADRARGSAAGPCCGRAGACSPASPGAAAASSPSPSPDGRGRRPVSQATVIVPTVAGGPRLTRLLESLRDRPGGVEILSSTTAPTDPRGRKPWLPASRASR